jgi:hypothetical protein
MVIGFVALFASMKDGGLLSPALHYYLFGCDYDARRYMERNNGYCTHCAYVFGPHTCPKCWNLGWWTIRRDLLVRTYLDESYTT